MSNNVGHLYVQHAVELLRYLETTKNEEFKKLEDFHTISGLPNQIKKKVIKAAYNHYEYWNEIDTIVEQKLKSTPQRSPVDYTFHILEDGRNSCLYDTFGTIVLSEDDCKSSKLSSIANIIKELVSNNIVRNRSKIEIEIS